jgi:hypothetical protein
MDNNGYTKKMSDHYYDNKRSNSIYASSYNDNDAISILRCAIRAADKNTTISGLYHQNVPISNIQYEEWGVVIQNEQILIDRKINSVRKVYLTNSKYRVGWILDSDLHFG